MAATAIRNIRFMNSKGRFTSLMRSKTAWWFTQIYADGEEADHVCSVRRPAFKQRIRQTSGLDLRDFLFQNKEGCGDGQDAIAEGLGAASAHCASLFKWLLLSRTKCARCYSRTTIATPAKR